LRTPKSLSYSAFALWEKDPEEYFLRYLAENRPARTLQERPAATGSAFDARAKSELHAAVFGAGSDDRYSYERLFEDQVEEHNRDWAGPEGDYVFACYKHTGFYDELLALLLKAKEPPRFEFTVEATLSGIPVLCKPDLRFVTEGVVHVVHDWKVNGYCSKSATSPHKAYMLCRDGFTSAKQNKSHNQEHKEYLGFVHGDLTINTTYMEACHPEWADQLCLYGWALGEKIGDEKVVLQIHQTVAKPMPVGRPQLRVSQYRARVKHGHQLELAVRINACWDAVESGHIFKDMSREDNDARMDVLNNMATALVSDGSDLENYFNESTRSRYRG